MERTRFSVAVILAMSVSGTAVAAAAGDADIQKCITDKLAAAPKLNAQGFTVSVQDGEAKLTGTARNPGSKGAATNVAKRCNAKTVSNEISIDKSAATVARKAKDKATGEEDAGAAASSAASSVSTDKVKDAVVSKAKDAASSKAQSVPIPALQ